MDISQRGQRGDQRQQGCEAEPTSWSNLQGDGHSDCRRATPRYIRERPDRQFNWTEISFETPGSSIVTP